MHSSSPNSWLSLARFELLTIEHPVSILVFRHLICHLIVRFTILGDTRGSAALKRNEAGSWAVIRQRHLQLQCGSTVKLELCLVQNILVPSLQ